MSPPNTANQLLRKAANQFRYYARNHRAKAATYQSAPHTDYGSLIPDTLAKAQINEDLAAEIEAFLQGEEGE